ncbi:MAG: cohesin domain-containing protein [Patescibacteria group bacterium]
MEYISQTKIVSALIFCVLFFVAAPVFSAEIFFTAKNQSFTQGEEFLAQVFLNTEKESLNAVEGKIIFPADLLEAREIRDGSSVINFWIERPRVKNISFSGITPGGYIGKNGLIFSVVFRAKKEGSGAIQIDGLRVLLNDGEGTPTSIKVSPFQFSISQKFSSALPMIESIEDIEPPEYFNPTIESDPAIFDGKYFLVFATQDKISGVADYKVREGEWGWFTPLEIMLRGLIRLGYNLGIAPARFNSPEEFLTGFTVAESPYLLKHQSLNRKIFIKAIDKAGNERVAMVEPRYPLKWYEFSLVWIIIISGIVVIYFIKRPAEQ